MALNMSAILNLGGNFVANMKKASDSTKSMQDKVKSFASNARAGLGAVGILAAGYMVSAVKSASTAQQSTARLQQLVENQGVSWGKASGQVNNFTSGVMKMSTFSAGDAKTALINLTTKGMKFNDALKSQKTLVDLASGGNMDLSSASNLLGMAYNGNYTRLVKLGVVTKAQVKAGLTFSKVQADINKKFGGSANAQLNTYAGRMAQLNNTMSAFKTSIGTYVLPYLQKFATYIANVAQKINSLSPLAKKTIAIILSLVGVFGTLIGGMSFVTKIFGNISPSLIKLGETIGELDLPIGLIIGAIALLTIAFTKNWGGIRTKTMAFINYLKPLIMNGIGAIVSWFNKTLPLMQQTVKTVLDFIKSLWTSHSALIMAIITPLWNGILTVIGTAIKLVENIIELTMNIINGNWKQAWTNICNIGSALFHGFVSVVKDVISSIGAIFSSLATTAVKWGSDFVNGLVKGITGGIGKIGSAVKGVASSIASFLHFSKPDQGVLRNYETWMPDMLKGMGKGLKVNASLVMNPIKDIALGIKTNIQGGTTGATATSTSSSSTGKGNIIINIPKLADSIIIREDSDIDKITTMLAVKLQKTSEGMA